MKRLFSLIFALVLMLSMSTAVLADVIWIPDDLFLNQHMKDCERTDRSYRALTEVKVYEDPESRKVLWTMVEGDTCWIYYTYEDADGNLWGCTENIETCEVGWIPLAYTELVYDHISFEEDYGHLFTQESGVLDETYVGQTIYFWRYPGYEFGYQVPVESYPPDYWHTYTDEDGRVWGYTGYYMGWKGYWFCVDDPTADFATLFPNGAPEVEITEPDETEPTLPIEEIVPEPSQKTREVYTILTVGVILCVAVSAVLLVRAKKKSK